jgi:hypothetical protein
MLITYRRTGGLIALLAVAAAALAVTVFTIAVAATLAIAAIAIAGVVRLGRAVLPRSWLDRTAPSATPWPHETIDGRVVTRTNSSDQREPPRLGGGTG